MGTRHKIVVRSPNWIGDQILAYPFFHYLREAYPSSHIAVVCSPWVEAVQFRNLVDEVHLLPKVKGASLWDKWQSLELGAEGLKQAGPWDLGICLPNSFSSAWLFYRSGVKRRRGYATDGRGFLLQESLPWSRKSISHRAEAYVRLVTEAPLSLPPVSEFWGTYPSNDLDPKIPGVLEQLNVETAWPASTPLDLHPFQIPGEYYVLAPGSTAESRRWPVERFAALARLIVDETGWSGLIVGGAGESSIARQLASDPSLKLVDCTARGPVTSYWKVFREAQFTLSNDSGLAHMASLCGSPVQVVWGAGNPRRTEPLGPGQVRVLFNPVACWPCESNLCSQPSERRLECLRGIFAEAVWKEIKAGIGAPSWNLK